MSLSDSDPFSGDFEAPDFQEQQRYFVSFGYSQSAEGERLLETRVHNVNNETEQRFHGLAVEQALGWIQQQTRARFLAAGVSLAAPSAKNALSQIQPPPETEYQNETYNEAQTDLEMEFVDLALEEVAVEAVASQSAQPPSSRTLRASGRLRVYSDESEEQKPYRVEFMLVNLDTADSRMAAADQGTIQPQELAREIIRDFPIPARGRYQVKAVVRTAPNSDVVAESRGPVLRVVE